VHYLVPSIILRKCLSMCLQWFQLSQHKDFDQAQSWSHWAEEAPFKGTAPISRQIHDIHLTKSTSIYIYIIYIYILLCQVELISYSGNPNTKWSPSAQFQQLAGGSKAIPVWRMSTLGLTACFQIGDHWNTIQIEYMFVVHMFLPLLGSQKPCVTGIL
jgi:hypothetical protein